VKVLANDADPDNDTLTIASFTQGTSGRVSKVGHVLVYTPRVTGALTDTFSYTVRDQRGATATATVTVNLTAQPMPKVTAVRLFPGPGTGSINVVAPGSRALPFQRLSRIEVTFSADVSVTADDLRLIGADGGPYSLSGFNYDSARRTASWVIDGPAAATWADRLRVVIDGSAATGVTGPGGVPIGDWAKTVSLLVGDIDGDGVVTATDGIAVRNRFGPVSGLTRLFADVDGNGVVDAADVDLAMANLGGRRA
jgi:Bacterial Ig domain/Dockerin type I domain